MEYLLRDLDPTLLLVIFLPVAISIAAWALRLACSFSSVEPPDFYQAILTVITVGITNVVLAYFMEVTQVTPGLGRLLITPLIATATIIALTIRTTPLSAVITTISFASICGGFYYSLTLINEVVVADILM